MTPSSRFRTRAAAAREQWRVRKLHRWGQAAEPTLLRSPGENRVGFLAGYGNTSYGDYFIGLGLAEAATTLGAQPVILGRGSHLAAFSQAQVEAIAVADRCEGLDHFDTALRDLDAVVVGGGGLFEDRVDASAAQSIAAGYAARGLRAATSGLPTAVFGVGIAREPFAFSTVDRVLSACLASSSFVGVRDSESLTALERLGVSGGRQVVDPAVIYLSSVATKRSPTQGRVGFVPFARKAWPRMDPPDGEAHQRQAADWAIAAEALAEHSPTSVLVVPFHKSDLHFLQEIEEALLTKLPGIRVQHAPFTPDQPGAAVEHLSTCEHVLTMRYHGFMAAHFSGVTSIRSVGTSQKLRVTQCLHDRGQLNALWNRSAALDDVEACLGALLPDEASRTT